MSIKKGLWKYKRGAKAGQNKPEQAFSTKVQGYIFVRKVVIPKRDYLTATLNRILPKVPDIFDKTMAQVTK
jgi:hypothetical protein